MSLRCVFHVGMPKTGSSSIQESLYFGLRAPGFRYVSLGEVNGDNVLMTSFADDASEFHFHRKMGRTPSEVAELRGRFRASLHQRMEQSQQRGEIVILSGESFWGATKDDFTAVADFLRQRGYEAEAIVYLRPWKSWLESVFQERIKQGERGFEVLSARHRRAMDTAGQLARLDEVFGASRVMPVLFKPDRFTARCVVQDFCSRARIPFAPRQVRRVNEGISLSALKLLYAQRTWGEGYGVGLAAVIRNEILCRRLVEVPGPPTRFHSRLVMPVLEEYLSQIPAIERRVGEGYREDLRCADESECLREESQMGDFSAESLDWLARATGLPRIGGKSGGASGEAASRLVAEQVQHLLEHPSLQSRLRWHRMIALRRCAEWLRDV